MSNPKLAAMGFRHPRLKVSLGRLHTRLTNKYTRMFSAHRHRSLVSGMPVYPLRPIATGLPRITTLEPTEESTPSGE